MIDLVLINNAQGVPDLAMDEYGNFIFVQDANCINQMIECALRLFIGEYEFNNELGISWVVAMEYGYTEIPLLQYQIQQTINELNNYINDDLLKIRSIAETDFTFTTDRRLTLSTNITLNNGTILGININV